MENSSFPTSDLSIFDYANIVNEMITRLQIEDAILIGHSFGGRIIALLTTMYTTKFKKLLLIDVAGLKPKNKYFFIFKTKSL